MWPFWVWLFYFFSQPLLSRPLSCDVVGGEQEVVELWGDLTTLPDSTLDPNILFPLLSFSFHSFQILRLSYPNTESQGTRSEQEDAIRVGGDITPVLRPRDTQTLLCKGYIIISCWKKKIFLTSSWHCKQDKSHWNTTFSNPVCYR